MSRLKQQLRYSSKMFQIVKKTREFQILFSFIFQEVANELEVLRIGPQHQAGSDSLLTGQTFFKMKEMFFEDDIDDSKYCGHLYGKKNRLIN